MTIISKQTLSELTGQARTNPRLRKNLNLHPNDDFPAHRLLNAMEPASYIRPHRHLDPNKAETFIIMAGRLGVLLFDDNGEVVEKLLLDAAGDNLGVDIPAGVFHTAVSLEEGTVFFEAKVGPFRLLTEEEKAPWAPEDGSAEVAPYLDSMKKSF
jgi:cupin fold WbuC family metalloprotein